MSLARKAESEDMVESIDLTKLFPAATVRSQLHREIPNLPRLSLPSSEVIGTTSALFLQYVIAQMSEKTVVKVADIQNVVCQNEDFAFLKTPLEELGMMEMIEKEKCNCKEYEPKRKRQSVSTHTAKKVMQSVVAAKESSSVLPSATETIIADTDEYD